MDLFSLAPLCVTCFCTSVLVRFQIQQAKSVFVLFLISLLLWNLCETNGSMFPENSLRQCLKTGIRLRSGK